VRVLVAEDDEGLGEVLARGLRDLADITLRIPMAGSASSLNVAVAHGIALHALVGERPGYGAAPWPTTSP